mgnify:CR=1 FL=1
MLQKSLFWEEALDASFTEIVERVERGQTGLMKNMLDDEVASTGSATETVGTVRDRKGEDNGASAGSPTETVETARDREGEDNGASTGSATATGEAAQDREGEDNGASTGSATATGEAARNRESGTRQERKKQWPYGLKNDKD